MVGRLTKFRFIVQIILLAFFLHSHTAFGECLALVKGAIAFDVDSCRAVNPATDLAEVASQDYFKGMTKPDRDRFIGQYRGLLLNGKVVHSKAVREGLSPERGVLNGEKISIFIPPGSNQCATMQAKRIAGVINEICCDGGADAPCLLKTSYSLQQITVVGEQKSAAGDQKRQAVRQSEDYKKGINFIRQKKYKEAAIALEKVKMMGELDIAGKYWLANTYRQLDMCAKVIPLAQEVIAANEKKEVWGDQLNYVRRSKYLLARCYAKTNRPGECAIILNSFLIEPKRNRQEILGSLSHPDFGWINATKEYQSYRKKAKEVLGK